MDFAVLLDEETRGSLDILDFFFIVVRRQGDCEHFTGPGAFLVARIIEINPYRTRRAQILQRIDLHLAQAPRLEFEGVDHGVVRSLGSAHGEPPPPTATRTVSIAPAAFC